LELQIFCEKFSTLILFESFELLLLVLFLLCRKWFTCWVQFACELRNQKKKKVCVCVCVFLGNELW
jgi:hypothetical protein